MLLDLLEVVAVQGGELLLELVAALLELGLLGLELRLQPGDLFALLLHAVFGGHAGTQFFAAEQPLAALPLTQPAQTK